MWVVALEMKVSLKVQIYCSSEDPQYPVQELETNTSQSKGWSTA
jgi:hypothetical protein